MPTVFEYDTIISGKEGAALAAPPANVARVPAQLFRWLDERSARQRDGVPRWIQRSQYKNESALKLSSYVGVLRDPRSGDQLEILPKTGKSDGSLVDGAASARLRLREMLQCLGVTSRVREGPAELAVAHMPLLEVFIHEFLVSVQTVVHHGLRGDFTAEQDNLFNLRGRLLVARQVALNLHRPDRFYTEHDIFSQNRPENRLIHTALRRVLVLAQDPENQRLARELCFVFSEVPQCLDVRLDFQRIRRDRDMVHYEPALGWARHILRELCPVSVSERTLAPSLLFPMQQLFEQFVAKHLKQKLNPQYDLVTRPREHHLVKHRDADWFELQPDLVVKHKHKPSKPVMVLDTKWKLLDFRKVKDKYELAQGDFYQVYAYGHTYLHGQGDLVLIYPKTEVFQEPLEVFKFNKHENLCLWVIPFNLESKKLEIHETAPFKSFFEDKADR